MKSHRFLILASVLTLGFLPAGCTEETETPPPPVRPVRTHVVGAETGSRVFEYPGSVSPVREAVLAFEVDGQLRELPVVEGQRVVAGQGLAQLDDESFTTERDEARAQLREARAEYERFSGLYESNAASLQDLEARRSAYEVAEAQHRRAQRVLNKSTLEAPFDGVVAVTHVENFQTVGAGQPVVTLQDLGAFEVVVYLPEQDWALGLDRLATDDEAREFRAEVIVSSFPDRRFAARLREIAAAANPSTRTFEAAFAFDTPSGIAIQPGMTARLILTQAGAPVTDAVRIPANAVVASVNETPSVWRLDPSSMTVRLVPVQTGDLRGSWMEIRSGLAPGDEIAVTGVDQLLDDMRVSRYEH